MKSFNSKQMQLNNFAIRTVTISSENDVLMNRLSPAGAIMNQEVRETISLRNARF